MATFKRPEEINDENLLTVDVDKIAGDNRFPELKFENAKNKLSKAQKWFLEAENLNYKELLVEEDIKRIDDLRARLKEHLQSLLTFDKRTTEANAQQEHNEIAGRTDNFYNEVYQQLAMRMLPFLRQETARSSADTQELEKQQQTAAQAEKQYKELARKLEDQLAALEKRKENIAEKRGEVAAITFGKHFEAQAEQHTQELRIWGKIRSAFFWAILILITVNFLWYQYLLFEDNNGGWGPNMEPVEFFTPEYGIVKIAFIAILFYGLSFASKNYRINANLSIVNKHRKNVAETLNNFLGSPGIEKEDKTQLVKMAAEAMFRGVTTGYVANADGKDDGPAMEVINNVLSSRKDG